MHDQIEITEKAKVTPGCYFFVLGTPEAIVPSIIKKESNVTALPMDPEQLAIEWKKTARGLKIEFPLEQDEEIFGFGLQLKSVCSKGTTRIVRSNADPVADTGDSHAPVPFFVSSKGYGMLFDTFRNVRFHCGVGKDRHRKANSGNEASIDVQDLYDRVRLRETTSMVVDVPVANGITVYLFQGNSVQEAIGQYVLFSGGGCRPPIWGLGAQFRCYARYSQQDVLNTADTIRDQDIPITMLGLEPGWQTHSYSCSLKWNNQLFSDPAQFVHELKERGFHLNLWEHAFLSPASPLYEKIGQQSCEYEVWKGIVPDLGSKKVQDILADYHRDNFVSIGIDGFKLDECDGSDYTGGWSYPDCSEFPSGFDGEQMHHAFGMLYQMMILQSLNGKPTFSLARNTGAFAAPYPFALYSDLYDFSDFVRGSVTAGYSGVLWAPEVRDAHSKEEFIQRLELAVFSAFMLINGWYQKELPWLVQSALEEMQFCCRLRIGLMPYLINAFYEYQVNGVPPVRGLPCEYADDSVTWTLEDEYLFGPSLLVAPRTDENKPIYLPKGEWYDFWTGEQVESGWCSIKQKHIPVFVRGSVVIPFTDPSSVIEPIGQFQLTPVCYGNVEKAFCLLTERNKQGENDARICLNAKECSLNSSQYTLKGFTSVQQYFTDLHKH